jgi:hypothetical protein
MHCIPSQPDDPSFDEVELPLPFELDDSPNRGELWVIAAAL